MKVRGLRLLAVVVAGGILVMRGSRVLGEDALKGWGDVSGDYQGRLTVEGEPMVSGKLAVKVEVKSNAVAALPKKEIRVWLMVNQGGGDHMFYTSAYAAPAHAHAAGEILTISFEAGGLAAYRYAPDLEIRDGIPTAADPKAPAPKSLGKITDTFAPGPARIKAFVVMTQEPDADGTRHKVVLVPTPTAAVNIADAPAVDFAALDAAGKKEYLDGIVKGLRGDAVSAKNAHDRAVKVGEPVVAVLLPLADDKSLPVAGQMWLMATLVELKDPRGLDALLKVVARGGRPAQVVCYYGPKLKDAKLTAAIRETAEHSKDQDLVAWAVRGLGSNGEIVDVGLLETMVAHSDAAGRAEAADIIAAYSDAKAVALLAKLVADPESSVRQRAIVAAFIHDRNEDVMMEAFKKAAQSDDPETKKLGKQAINKMGKK